MPIPRVLFSTTGGPSTAYAVRWFQKQGFEVYGGDANPEAIGHLLCDHFTVLPRQDAPDYFDAIFDLIEQHEIDYYAPFGEQEALEASKMRACFEERGCTLVAANTKTLEIAIDKPRCYAYLKAHTDIPIMRHRLVTSASEFDEALAELAPAGGRLCVKPASGSGSRGFVLLDDTLTAEAFFSSKNDLMRLPTETIRTLLTDSAAPPRLLLMEYLEGVHYDTNMVCRDGEILFQSAKTREEARIGTITRGTIVRHEALEAINRQIARALDTTGLISTQFIGDTLVEINPRWSTSILTDDVDEYMMSLQVCAGEPLRDDLPATAGDGYLGTRMIRHWDIAVY